MRAKKTKPATTSPLARLEQQRDEILRQIDTLKLADQDHNAKNTWKRDVLSPRDDRDTEREDGMRPLGRICLMDDDGDELLELHRGVDCSRTLFDKLYYAISGVLSK